VINKINGNLEQMADGGRVRFLNINDSSPTLAAGSSTA